MYITLKICNIFFLDLAYRHFFLNLPVEEEEEEEVVVTIKAKKNNSAYYLNNNNNSSVREK